MGTTNFGAQGHSGPGWSISSPGPVPPVWKNKQVGSMSTCTSIDPIHTPTLTQETLPFLLLPRVPCAFCLLRPCKPCTRALSSGLSVGPALEGLSSGLHPRNSPLWSVLYPQTPQRLWSSLFLLSYALQRLSALLYPILPGEYSEQSALGSFLRRIKANEFG